MLQKFMNIFVRKRHFWRDVTFGELAEIYTSMSLRSFGFSIIGVFVPVYLYKEGVSLHDLFLFFTVFFLIRIFLSYPVAQIVARIGPKHTIALSTVVFIMFLLQLLSYGWLGWPLILLSFMFTLSMSMFFMGYNTDFSKIQHSEHGGKELGWLFIFERVGGALGPLIGGLAAGIFFPEITIILSLLVLLGSLIPLFLTNEPVKIHQHLKFKGFPHKDFRRDYLALTSFNIVNASYNIVWPLLVAVFIFTDGTYQKLGILVAASMLISVFTAFMFGKFIDNKKGSSLLNYGVGLNFVLQLSKALVTTSGGAIAVTALGEPANISIRMPLVKAYFEAASSVEGYRIVYLMWGEFWGAFGKFITFFGMFIASYHFDSISVMRGSFVFFALIGLAMSLQRFPALKKV